MKLQSSNTKRVYEMDVTAKRTICPECSHNRRKAKELIVTWDLANNRGFCHHCETSFFEYEARENIVYTFPEWKNITSLSDKAVKYFEGRAISQKTLNVMRVYSDKEFMPQFGKEVDVICFPYFSGEKLVNIKYRGPEKSFKLYQGAELIFWNLDAIGSEVVIVEGEIDLLSFIEAGIKEVISVPAGANKNLEYLDSCFERFKEVETIFLATDNDRKGIELRDELARRFGFARCKIVNFRECKDANEFLTKFGGMELRGLLETAAAFPVNGLVHVNDFYGDLRSMFETGILPGLKLDTETDKYVTWEGGRLVIVTGIPGHGKSEFVDFMICKLNLLYGWKSVLFTPENYPLKYHYAKVFEKFVGKKYDKNRVSEQEFSIAYEHIRDNFYYVLDEEDYSLELVLTAARQLIQSKGVKILVIDPYNKLEYQGGKGETETQYISRFLDKLHLFARINNILLILVAHPRKMQKDQYGKYMIPTLYDISGSAHFYNKADYGICVYRVASQDNTGYENRVEVHIQKVKFKHLGECGAVDMKYNYNNGRFENVLKASETWDNSNWLIRDPLQNKQIEIEDWKINESPF